MYRVLDIRLRYDAVVCEVCAKEFSSELMLKGHMNR